MVNEATIVCDLSGSMMECGKRYAMNTALRTIDQYYQMLNPDAEIKLLGWGDEIEYLQWMSGDDFPEKLLDCHGSSGVDTLIKELGDYLDAPVLILSDGYWDDRDNEFESWAKSHDDGYVRVVLLGADANRRLDAPYVFTAENILAALEEFGD
ncbi:MAG: hypothetical protein IJI68_05045 [Eggerthellaceae bacterium]|nr:hypothetical protein [Eggerthellaceae bacterium]